MKNIIKISSLILLCSCSTTIIYAPKTNNIIGEKNKAEIKGSELDGNNASQTSDGTLKLTIP